MSSLSALKKAESIYMEKFDHRDTDMSKYLAKFHKNLCDAEKYLKMITALANINNKSDLLYEIQIMAIHSLLLTFRRCCDTQGKKSFRNFIRKYGIEPSKSQHLSVIDEVLAKYKGIIDTGITHQDDTSIVKLYSDESISLKTFTDDFNKLKNLYVTIALEIRPQAPGFSTATTNYTKKFAQLNKMR